ncbi:Hypothetical predicted protein [Mytilus galloprovincialis]|uniref:Uncharacterized protein n=1 Tax=Mytilus galloprovincialis TaxID=29158 RepID=A0A8B6CIP3_MYTGA|nr:Hypothetical predicted protein [Mytilus galloprovincialis]
MTSACRSVYQRVLVVVILVTKTLFSISSNPVTFVKNFLIKQGIPKRNKSKMASGEQHLHLSVRENDKEKLGELLGAGVDINCLFYGWTPLQVAIQEGNEDIGVFLIEKGCDYNFHDRHSVTPFEDAVNRNLSKIIGALISKGVKPDEPLSTGNLAICVAAEKSYKELLQTLINGGASVNSVNNEGATPLYIASKEGHNGLIQTLLNARANVNMPCEKGEQHTPLIAATAAEQFDVIKLLLKNNCDINAPDKDGWTPLWHAYGNNDEDSMKLLLKSGADKNVKNADGVTIMDEAKDADDDSMIELLQSFSQAWT